MCSHGQGQLALGIASNWSGIGVRPANACRSRGDCGAEDRLTGSIEMGLRGEDAVTLTPGQTFYEGPEDIHTVSRNASSTQPAKFLVVLMKNSGEPIVMPVH